MSKHTKPVESKELETARKAFELPVVETKEIEYSVDPCPMPKPEDYVDGIFTRISDGEDYALCIHAENGHGRTHTAKNSVHMWQGTAESFNAAFTHKR